MTARRGRATRDWISKSRFSLPPSPLLPVPLRLSGLQNNRRVGDDDLALAVAPIHARGLPNSHCARLLDLQLTAAVRGGSARSSGSAMRERKDVSGRVPFSNTARIDPMWVIARLV